MSNKVRAAVIGHVEWVEFLRVDRDVSPGAILHADSGWQEAAGGAGVAAAVLAELAGGCDLYTAVGDDEVGRLAVRQLEALGVVVHAQRRQQSHRRAVTLLAPSGERTITVIGPAQSPTGEELDHGAFGPGDAVYFCKGDVEALRRARRAGTLVVTARVLDIVQRSGVLVDALVYSVNDPAEVYREGALSRRPTLVAATAGDAGGTWSSADGGAGVWSPAELPRAIVDTYGAGDSFAAGLTYALGQGMQRQAAIDVAARCGAAAVCRRGAHGRSRVVA